jgi:histidine triad (HIT) family protein
MHNHAPDNYVCPICLGVRGVENDDTMIRQSDIVFQDELVTAFIGSFFVGNNPGHPIVVPNEHFENIYDLPEKYGQRIFVVTKKLALALKQARSCEGVTVVQNNEPAGNQHAFHYHLHVFPRFTGDELHLNMHNSRKSTSEERLPYVSALKEHYGR